MLYSYLHRFKEVRDSLSSHSPSWKWTWIRCIQKQPNPLKKEIINFRIHSDFCCLQVGNSVGHVPRNGGNMDTNSTLIAIGPSLGGCFWETVEGSLASVAQPVHVSSSRGTICSDFSFSGTSIFPQRLKLAEYLFIILLLLLQMVSSITDHSQLGTSDQVSTH